MKTSPLSLEQHVFKRVCITASDKVPDRAAVNVLNVALRYAHHQEDRSRYLVELDIRLLADRKPNLVSAYVGDVAIEGIFRANLEDDGKQLSDFLILTNAASMLFGAVREMVLNLTSRGPWPAVMLTTVSFMEMVNDIIGEQPPDVPREDPLLEPVFPWGARRH